MNNFIQVPRYSATALASTVCDWLVFVGLVFFGFKFVFAQMISRIFGGVVAFLLHRSWSFQNTDGHRISTQGRRFLLLYAFSYCFSISLLYMFTEWLHMEGYLSKIIADTLCFVVNFLLMRFYVFTSSEGIITRLCAIYRTIMKTT